ncbi:TolC family protein [Methylococcus sp. EFPC2]|uniref:TolC family protein n=1 Tax=Methylococcus sp. EFPC2 TaxID=2812648 RepID=UPI001966FAE2|nr:TolC family protein [Methylococcus sp. EFPC2]QSA96608.1 TolC family protein [Methylococcus sp. EFPC2]
MSAPIRVAALIGLCCLFGPVFAAEDLRYVDHYDELRSDPKLSLQQVVDATFQQYPQGAVIAALQDEAQALHRRSDSLVAGYPMVYLQWINDAPFNDRGRNEIQTGYQIPVWMWGQRAASRNVAGEAEKGARRFADAVKHEVAGLVRETLWNLALVENRHELARKVYEVSEQTLHAVTRRVELGDLARTDQLMAESDLLDKKNLLVLAEAEVMHARKAYQNLTRMERAPAVYDEHKSPLHEIAEQHPAVAAANAVVERAQAEVEFTRLSKQGNQPSILIGSQHDRGARGEGYDNGTNLVVQIPFGGEAWNAPQVAGASLTLNQKIADRGTLLRQLEKALHEAQHNLEVDEKALELAGRRREIAETHLRMSKLAFEAGEIPLIDYLKIQANAQAAIRDAAERAILLKRDTAFYNQVVGVMP